MQLKLSATMHAQGVAALLIPTVIPPSMVHSARATVYVTPKRLLLSSVTALLWFSVAGVFFVIDASRASHRARPMAPRRGVGKTIYSHDLRLVVCGQCGAPIEAELSGGTVRCDYCGAQSQLARRDESADRAEAEQARADATSESERLERLWAQEKHPFAIPASLARYLSGSELAPEQQRAALDEWLTTHKRVAAGTAFAESERLFHLTLLLSPKLEDRHARALQESAVEVLPDKRHRQVLRCMLAEHAVRAGDLEAAEQWLESCNPRPTDLRMDTAYRVAASYLATARGDHAKVLAQLGYRIGDVPIAAGHADPAAVLRANALERTSDARAAEEQLLTLMRSDAGKMASLQAFMTASARLGLCPRSGPSASRAIWQEVDHELRPELTAPWLLAILGTLAVILDTGLVLAIVLIEDTDPRVAIGANVGFWGAAATAAAVLGIVLRRRARELRERGRMTLARVVSTKTNKRESEEDRATTHSVVLEFEHGGTTHRHATTTKSKRAPAGQYPLLYDPENPKNAAAKL